MAMMILNLMMIMMMHIEYGRIGANLWQDISITCKVLSIPRYAGSNPFMGHSYLTHDVKWIGHCGVNFQAISKQHYVVKEIGT